MELDNLEKGKYYIYVVMEWDEGQKHRDFTVNSYGKSKVIFHEDEAGLFN